LIILSTTAPFTSPTAGAFVSTAKKIISAPSSRGRLSVFKEVEEGIWLVSFMEYDLGYIDLEEKTLQPLDNPFGPKVLPM
jgi:hypothetical protein